MGKTFRRNDPRWSGVFERPAGRDKKPWHKPPKGFKQSAKDHRKAQERAALRQIELGNEDLDVPNFRKTDKYDYL